MSNLRKSFRFVLASVMVALMSVSAYAAAIEPPITVPLQRIETANISLDKITKATAPAINLDYVMAQIQKFYPLHAEKKAEILAKENAGYLPIIEHPEEALSDKRGNRRLIESTYRHVSKLDKRMMREIKRIDALVIKADNYCSSKINSKIEAKCVTLHDHIGLYEGKVSVMVAMFEVMKKRYEEAKLVLEEASATK